MLYKIFGDTGGHFQQLFKALIEIGLDPNNYTLPKNIVIIHVGDLIHKGPRSHDVLMLVDKIRIINPGQWIQLIGNHEHQYLGGEFFWRNTLETKSVKILQNWFTQGFLQYAFVIPRNGYIGIENTIEFLDKPTVITHAGISPDFYYEYLQNVPVQDIPEKMFSINVGVSGIMMNKHDVDEPIGPIWAHGIHEVWTPWLMDTDMPFHQIVGHISPYVFTKKKFFPKTPESFIHDAEVFEKDKVVVIKHNKDMQIFVDPGYEKQVYDISQPYITVEI